MRVEERCATEYAQAHPVDASRRLEKMPADVSVAFLQTLPQATVRQILAAMQVTAAADCLAALPDLTSSLTLRDVSVDHAARLLRFMPRARADALLAAIPGARREQIKRIMHYPANTAGAMMDPTVLAVADDLTVGDAQREFRRAAASADIVVYVVNRDYRLVGTLELRELYGSDKNVAVTRAMHKAPVSVSPLTDLASLMVHAAWEDLDALPVTGREGRLLGVIRHRTLRQAMAVKGDVRLEQVGVTVTRLGEIYWATLGALMATLSAVSAPAASKPLTGGRTP